MDENVSTFCGITGASADVAQGFITLAGDDVERAIELFFENPELASQIGNTGGAAARPQPAAAARVSRAGREDADGVIHIDSDDEDDFMRDIDDDDDDNEAAEQAANRAQEEEDAAMAKRLQEELYGSGSGAGGAGGAGGEDVRAPIARTTETLVAPDMGWGGGVDEESFLSQMRRRRPPPGRSGGPFSQRIWDAENPSGESTSENGGGGASSHVQRLADLFRPPYDLMERDLEWDDARALGKQDKKWIMVNLQDMNDFNCQALNRDIWKDRGVRSLVQEHFLFLQYDKDFPDAEEYTTFYLHGEGHQNPDIYPYVSIIDPRTGEQVKVWSGRPFPSASDFQAQLAEFLDRYSLERNSKNPVAPAGVKQPRTVDVGRMTEEEMLEMALKNSMAGGSATPAAGESSAAATGSGSTSTTNLYDPDALTKQQGKQAAGTEAEEASAEVEAEDAGSSAFASISSSNPHEEPATTDAATTTRIQFRHPNGRVIRRFGLDEPVRRAYEWLKAAPLEGKEGVPFELKVMPAGRDLIDDLDRTIGECGLKQGTVMIEFLD